MSLADAKGAISDAGERLGYLHHLLSRAWTRFDEGTLAHDILYAAYSALDEIGWGDDPDADKWLGRLSGLVDD